jgi:undecaprenyl-diphosphatase
MLRYILLGTVQGLTEFFPVSSSGHLVILQKVLRVAENQLALTVILHLGTTLSLVVFFFQDLLGLLKNFRLLIFLFIATIITVIIALLGLVIGNPTTALWPAGKVIFEGLFSSPALAAAALIVSGIILIITRKFMSGIRDTPNFKDAAILGLSQSIAIIPGISRSGITVSTLLFRGMNRENSFRLSFLAAIPVVFGATIFEARKIDFALQQNFTNLLVGFSASFIAGLLALWILRKVLNRARLYYFGYYCIIAAVVTLIFIK